MSPPSRPLRALAAALALTGAGCGSDAATGSTDASSVATSSVATSSVATSSVATTAESETTVAETGAIDPTVQALVDIATADLVGRLGIDAGAVTVLSAAAITWPDKSLGCPKPGLQYLQVLVDGALIELSAGGKTYSYHSGDDAKPTLCEQTLTGTAIPPVTTS